MVRPVTYYLIAPVAVGCVVWAHVRLRQLGRVGAVLLLVILPSILLVGGWQLRNYRVSGSSEFSQVKVLNLLSVRGAGIVALRDGIPLSEAQHWLRSDLGIHSARVVTPELEERMKEEAFRLIRQHPVVFLRMEVTGAMRLLIGPGVATTRDLIGRRAATPLIVLALVHLGLLYCGVLAWLFLPGETRDITTFALLGIAMYFVIVSAGPEAYSRFRVPTVPIFSLVSAAGLVKVLRRTHRCPTALGLQQ